MIVLAGYVPSTSSLRLSMNDENRTLTNIILRTVFAGLFQCGKIKQQIILKYIV